MSMRKASFCALLALCLSACATGYHSANDPIRGYSGGYWDEPGPGELTKVGFAGNGYIDRDTVVAYLMYHCAELAQQRHKPYFRVYPSLVDAIRDRPVDEVTIGRVGGKLGDWVFVLFDATLAPGDLAADATMKKYAVYVRAQEQHS